MVCEVGTYQDREGAQFCQACPAKTSTAGTLGAVACSSCADGLYNAYIDMPSKLGVIIDASNHDPRELAFLTEWVHAEMLHMD